MLIRSDLKSVARKRLKDAHVLLQKKRYGGAVYLGGYTVELLLKLRICHVLKFKNGFPETEAEFGAYKNALHGSKFNRAVTKLKQIKCHDLNRLLFYSGKETAIRKTLGAEWENIAGWGPELRYSSRVIRKAEALTFLTNCQTIIENL